MLSNHVYLTCHTNLTVFARPVYFELHTKIIHRRLLSYLSANTISFVFFLNRRRHLFIFSSPFSLYSQIYFKLENDSLLLQEFVLRRNTDEYL